MSSHRITRQITSLGTAGYACTVMAIRKDKAGKNEFAVRLCSTWAAAERAARLLEVDIRQRVLLQGGEVMGTRELAQAH